MNHFTDTAAQVPAAQSAKSKQDAALAAMMGKMSKGLSRKKRVGKRELTKRLNEENMRLKEVIAQLQQQISAVEAQNSVLGEQLSFFSEQIKAKMNNNGGNNDQLSLS